MPNWPGSGNPSSRRRTRPPTPINGAASRTSCVSSNVDSNGTKCRCEFIGTNNEGVRKNSHLPPFLDRVARQILSRHARGLPDLRRVTVLLPNYHVAQPLAQALSAAANLPALLLPQMVTLNDWVQSVPLAAP